MSSITFTEPFDNTPFSTESAADPLAGSASRLKVAATSLAVIDWPSWNLTFGRSLNVHTSPFSFGFHESAREGRSSSSSPSSSIRNSPV